MGKGIVDELKKEFDINDEWVGFELHPETPEKGVNLNHLFPQSRRESMYEHLRKMGSEFNIKFGDVQMLSNTRKSLLAAEFARDHGKIREFSQQTFKAYFTDCLNIGDHKVIDEVAKKCGLDITAMHEAISSETYKDRLEEAAEEAQKYEINSIPTFIINDTYKIVGAQPLESFREYLKGIENQ